MIIDIIDSQQRQINGTIALYWPYLRSFLPRVPLPPLDSGCWGVSTFFVQIAGVMRLEKRRYESVVDYYHHIIFIARRR